jgi:hypothetical protein
MAAHLVTGRSTRPLDRGDRRTVAKALVRGRSPRPLSRPLVRAALAARSGTLLERLEPRQSDRQGVASVRAVSASRI